MDTKRVHIRGNMGTQILELAVALATLKSNEEPVICVNHGGNLGYDATDQITKVLQSRARIVNVDMFNKTPYWIPGAAAQVFENLDEIYRYLNVRTDFGDLEKALDKIVHIRMGDKPLCRPETYQEIINYATHDDPIGDPVICTDENVTVRNTISKAHRIYCEAPDDDWRRMYYAEKIYAAPSSFIMSMLIFNPKKKVTFFGKDYCDGTYNVENDMIFLREMQSYCPHMEIIDDRI